MATLSRGERLQIMLTDDELSALDDFRFKYRMPSRAAAVRQILRQGLGVQGPDPGKGHSRDFGVIAGEASPRRRNNGG